MVRCNQCGKDNQPGSKFCGGCGGKLAVQPQAPAPQPAALPPVQPGYAPPPPPAQAGRPMPPPPPGMQGGYASQPAAPPVHPGYAPPPPAQAGRPMPPPPPVMQGGYPPQPGYQGSPPPVQAGYGQPPAQNYPPAGYQQQYPQQSAGYAFEKTPQLGWKRKNAGIICYALGWLSGLIMFFMEKDPFVRFHAAQSVAIFGGLQVLTIALPMAMPRGLAGAVATLMSLMSLASMVLWILLMYKASKAEYYKLPVIGDMVDKFVRDNPQ